MVKCTDQSLLDDDGEDDDYNYNHNDKQSGHWLTAGVAV
jgi:hypothetical protein